MIQFIFTLDYEVYGDGRGSLSDLVYGPTEELTSIFLKRGQRFVAFIEMAELEIIEANGTDRAFSLVRTQVQELHRNGFELGLHLHPQWYNARFENGRWLLDNSEYNLCTLPKDRINEIVRRAIDYFRNLVGARDFTPVSFRAGNWLLQPTKEVARALAENGIKVDSSVFKGGLRRQHKMDYREALRNGYLWRFADRVETPDSGGLLLEIPIHTEMVPFWKMLSPTRLGLESSNSSTRLMTRQRLFRLWDIARLRHPLKLDFCRMALHDMVQMTERVIQADGVNPELFRPIVAIGHTKELLNTDAIDAFLHYLAGRRIKVVTFQELLSLC